MNRIEKAHQRISDLEKELKQLKEEVKLFDKNNKLKITKVINYDSMNKIKQVYLNNRWAYTYFIEELEGDNYDGCKCSGHNAVLYLSDSDGCWYDKNGDKIEGYLFYKPNKEIKNDEESERNYGQTKLTSRDKILDYVETRYALSIYNVINQTIDEVTGKKWHNLNMTKEEFESWKKEIGK